MQIRTNGKCCLRVRTARDGVDGLAEGFLPRDDLVSHGLDLLEGSRDFRTGRLDVVPEPFGFGADHIEFFFVLRKIFVEFGSLVLSDSDLVIGDPLGLLHLVEFASDQHGVLQSGGDLATDFSECVFVVVELSNEHRRNWLDDVLFAKIIGGCRIENDPIALLEGNLGSLLTTLESSVHRATAQVEETTFGGINQWG